METQNLILRLRERGVILGPDHFVIGDGYGNPDHHCSLFVVEEALYRAEELQHMLLDLLWREMEKVELDCIIAANRQSLPMAESLGEHARTTRGLAALPVLAYSKKNIPTRQCRILIHDDIVNRGRQTGEIIRQIESSNLKPVAISSLFTRVDGNELYGLPIFTAIKRLLASYPPGNCPLCEKEIPVNTRYGKGAQFLGKPMETPKSNNRPPV